MYSLVYKSRPQDFDKGEGQSKTETKNPSKLEERSLFPLKIVSDFPLNLSDKIDEFQESQTHEPEQRTPFSKLVNNRKSNATIASKAIKNE